jgi:hypothetical protein
MFALLVERLLTITEPDRDMIEDLSEKWCNWKEDALHQQMPRFFPRSLQYFHECFFHQSI